MEWRVDRLRVFSDNFVYFLIEGNRCAIVDPSESEPVLRYLEEHHLYAEYILNTHHHMDHVGGNLAIKQQTHARIYCYEADKLRIPGADIGLSDSETIKILGQRVEVIWVPGHTLGHIAFYFPSLGILFPGDTLFVMGCGRIFEGTPVQMYKSLLCLKSLPEETMIYPGHDYAADNLKFAMMVEPENNDLLKEQESLLEEGRTIPTTLGRELATNPFLRAGSPAIRNFLSMDSVVPDEEVFTALRQKKNHY